MLSWREWSRPWAAADLEHMTPVEAAEEAQRFLAAYRVRVRGLERARQPGRGAPPSRELSYRERQYRRLRGMM